MSTLKATSEETSTNPQNTHLLRPFKEYASIKSNVVTVMRNILSFGVTLLASEGFYNCPSP